MKKIILTSLIAFFASAVLMASSQKKPKVTYDKKTGMITLSGVDYAKLKKENAPGQLGINKNYTITNLDGDDLIYMSFTQEDIRDIYGRKTDEKKTYYKITFLGSGKHGIRNGTMTALGAAKIAARNNLIVNGNIDPAAEKKFLLKY